MDENEKKIVAEGLLNEKIFRCKTCWTDQTPKWTAWSEAEITPIQSDENKVTIRGALFCKDCHNQFGIYTIASLPEIKKMADKIKAKIGG
jgi:hypothetical protein